MNNRLVAIALPAVFPGAAVALGDDYAYFTTPCDLTVVYVSAAPSQADADLTLDINDDGSGVITAISCAVVATPGTWKSIHMGGANSPVHIAAGSKVSFDANGAANATQIVGFMLALTGEEWS